MDQVRTPSPDTPASDALETVATRDVHLVPVVDHGRMQGLVSRGDLLRVLQAKTALGV